jgi:hypothetical protein
MTISELPGYARINTYRFSEQEIMIFRLDAQVLEHGTLPETLHVVLPSRSAMNSPTR